MKTITEKGQVPPGGWAYTEPATGVKFTNNHFLALMQDIRKHRLACDLPVHGNWAEVVHDVICRQNPQVGCMEEGEKPAVVTPDDIRRFIETMLELRGNELVSEEEQARRIDICLECPKRGQIACRWCGWLAEKVTEILGGRQLHKVEKIFKQSCMACKCDISAKTAIPMDVLRRVDERIGFDPAGYHEKCWMRETSHQGVEPQSATS